MDIFSFLMLLAGLSFFLYGMNIMGSGLEKRAGSRLRGLLEKATSRPIKGVLLGTGVTSVIQSSSATTVMVVGFVNAGVLTLERTVGIIMGANIGTTITAWILSLTGIRSTNILLQMFKPANFSPILAAIGVVLVFFQKKERQRDIGQTLLGFAILMFGMEFMSGAVKPLGELESFRSTLTLFSNPIIGVLVGTVFTAIIQSSSASIGILQAMSLSVNISFATALPILMGQNIGTCITALLSCVGANTDAKRAAFVHLYFNIIGVALFMAVFLVLKSLSLPIMAVPVNPVMIATVHTTFNVINTAIQLPFSNKLARLATISIKSKGKDEIFQPLDDRLLSTPSVAISQCRSLAVDMARLAKETMADALSLINKYDEDVAQKVEKGEEELDMYEDHMGTFLVKISARSLSEQDSNAASTILHSIGDFERIGDHAQNILESAKEMNDKIICFSPAANAELAVLSRAVLDIVERSIDAFIGDDLSLAYSVEPLEEVIDELRSELKSRHIARLQKGLCTIELGFIFSDIITDMERIADHCSNIALTIIQSRRHSYDTHRYINELRDSGNPEFAAMHEHYGRIYSLADSTS